MGKEYVAKTFKSGNSVALRLPKALGIKEGIEMKVREERGQFIVQPAPTETPRIDLTGIWGSIPGLKTLTREERAFDDPPRPWHDRSGRSADGR